MANGNTPWGDEQSRVDEYGAGTTAVAPETAPGPIQGPGLMTIGAGQWREQTPGPVDLQGQGIRIAGGTPTPPTGLNPLTEQYFRDREQFLEQQRQRAYIADLMAQAGPVNANQAIEKAMRMEGVLGFEADRKAGMPLMEAMSKHAGKMFYNNPSGMIQMARLQQQNQPFTPREITLPSGATVREMSRGRFANVPQVSPPGTPTEASPIIDPVTKQVLGHMVRTPEGRYHPVTAQREDRLRVQDKIGIIRMQLDQIKAEIEAAAYLGKKERQKKMEDLGKERQGLYDQLKTLGVPMVKEKETGQSHFYTGSLDELPDTHELIDQASEGEEEGQA